MIKNKTKHPLYSTWKDMRRRCRATNRDDYKYYKDISVCKRWNIFENFVEDMGLKPNKSFTLDRIDNTKGYFKENCRWASIKQQNNNTSQSKKVKNIRTGEIYSSISSAAAFSGYSREYLRDMLNGRHKNKTDFRLI